MSAIEIIEQIKALPPEEKAEVVKFVHDLAVEDSSTPRSISYASPSQAKKAGDSVTKQYQEVFRRLAK